MSDDSLEVVVVRRSLEKKLEKVSQYAGRKSKTPRETTKETKITETKKKSSKKKSKISRTSSTGEDNGNGRKSKSQESASEESMDKNDATIKREKNRRGSRFREDVTDSTSQDTVERVTVTALIHKDQAPDTPKTSTTPVTQPKVQDTLKTDGLAKSSIEDILEKADEMQNALMTKAADLKKDVDEIRRQSTGQVAEDEQKSTHTTPEKGRKEDESETESTSEDSQLEFSRLQSQHEEECVEDKPQVENMVNNQRKPSKTQEDLQITEKKIDDQNKDRKDISSTPESQEAFAHDKSTTNKKSSASGTEVSDSDKETTNSQTLKSDKSQSNSAQTTSTSPKITDTHTNEETTITVKKSECAELEKDIKTPNADENKLQTEPTIMGTEGLRHIDSSSSSAKSTKRSARSRPSTGKGSRGDSGHSKSPSKHSLFESSSERSPGQSAIVAVIESPEWDEEDEEVAKEIRDVVGDTAEGDTEPEDDDSLGVLRVLPSTSEEETPRRPKKLLRVSKKDTLPRVSR